jgi:hypothetical protein
MNDEYQEIGISIHHFAFIFHHSYLSATSGSTFVARRAGM